MLCGTCGRSLEEGAQFCGECGTQVGAISGTPHDLGDGVDPTGTVTLPEVPVVPAVAASPPEPTPPASVYGAPPAAPPPAHGGVGAPGTPTGPPPSESSQGAVPWLIGGICVVLLLILGAIGFLLTRGNGDDDASPATTVAPVPTTAPEPTTEVPTPPAPDTEVPPTTATTAPTEGATTVDELCANAQDLADQFQQAFDDPSNFDPTTLNALIDELTQNAQDLSSTATPEDLQRIADCMSSITATP